MRLEFVNKSAWFFGVFEEKQKFFWDLLTFLEKGPLKKWTKHSKSRTKKYTLCLKAKFAVQLYIFWPTSPFFNLWKPHETSNEIQNYIRLEFFQKHSSTLFMNQYNSENTHGKLSLYQGRPNYHTRFGLV